MRQIANECPMYRRILTQGAVLQNPSPDQPSVEQANKMLRRALNFLPSGDVICVSDPVNRMEDRMTMDDWTSLRPSLPEMWIETVTAADQYGPGAYHGALVSALPEMVDGYHVVWMFGFFQRFDMPKVWAGAAVRISMDEQGTAERVDCLPMHTRMNVDEDYDFQNFIVYPVTRTIQIIGGVNTALTPLNHDKVTRKHLASIKAPEAANKYHIITLTDPRYRPHGPGNKTGNLPLQVRRGHWSHYGEEYGRGLLFGQRSGRFWKPAKEIGDVRYGRRTKDYRVDPASFHKPAEPFPASASEAQDAAKVFDPIYTDQPAAKPQEAN